MKTYAEVGIQLSHVPGEYFVFRNEVLHDDEGTEYLHADGRWHSQAAYETSRPGYFDYRGALAALANAVALMLGNLVGEREGGAA